MWQQYSTMQYSIVQYSTVPGVAAVDAGLGGGGNLAILAASPAALQPLLPHSQHSAPEKRPAGIAAVA